MLYSQTKIIPNINQFISTYKSTVEVLNRRLFKAMSQAIWYSAEEVLVTLQQYILSLNISARTSNYIKKNLFYVQSL